MSVSKYMYSPEKCDGDFCPGDCDRCSKAEEECDYEPDDSQLEMGFNPYSGCYDFDC